VTIDQDTREAPAGITAGRADALEQTLGGTA
jgi:hypothetical protein